MAVTSRCAVEEVLEVGQGGGGLGQGIEAELNETRVFKRRFGAGDNSAGVAPWTAMHSLPTRRRGWTGRGAGANQSCWRRCEAFPSIDAS